MISATRALPANTDAERALLGGILMEPSILADVRTRVRPDTFFGDVNRRIYLAMLALDDAAKPLDLVSLSAQLGPELERIGGNEALMAIAGHVPTAAGVSNYADILAGLATRRALIQEAARIAEAAYSDDLTPQAAAARIEALHTGRTIKSLNMADAVTGAVRLSERYHKSGGMLGMSTGFHGLDGPTSGLCRGDLIVIGARSGHGKSALALCMAINAARKGRHVAYLNGEMKIDRFILRALASESGVGYRKLRGQDAKTRDDLLNLTKAAPPMMGLPITFYDQDCLDINDFAAECRRLKSQGKLDIAFADYAQMMHNREMSGRESREQVVASIVHGLKGIAMRLDIPVVALAQLNRMNDARIDRRPSLSDMRESAAFEHAAGVIFLLHSPGKYAKTDQEKKDTRGQLEIVIAKNRDGPAGALTVHFDPETMRISDASPGSGSF